jgi:hypothetical protein
MRSHTCTFILGWIPGGRATTLGLLLHNPNNWPIWMRSHMCTFILGWIPGPGGRATALGLLLHNPNNWPIWRRSHTCTFTLGWIPGGRAMASAMATSWSLAGLAHPSGRGRPRHRLVSAVGPAPGQSTACHILHNIRSVGHLVISLPWP